MACDLHPKYNATVVAEELGLPVLKIQHHFAHILSCMAENDCEDPVIGVSFDGTGYGTDGTIWVEKFFVVITMDLKDLAALSILAGRWRSFCKRRLANCRFSSL